MDSNKSYYQYHYFDEFFRECYRPLLQKSQYRQHSHLSIINLN